MPLPRPDSSLTPPARRQQFVARVVENRSLCREHFGLWLRVRQFPATLPGQFIQISCREPGFSSDGRDFDWPDGAWPTLNGRETAAPLALLRRPFSLAGRRDTPDGASDLLIIHRIVGVGTDWLSHLAVGDEVGIIGPLGNAFSLPPVGHTMVMVGGGVGIPPMLYLASSAAGRPAAAFAGALSRDLLPLTINHEFAGNGTDDFTPRACIDEFSRHGVMSVVCTDDGSLGYRGLVTQALERYLDTRTGAPATIYTCGPEPMMKRVAQIAADRGLNCQVAVERAMACGMGTCQSCCIRVRKPDPAQPPLPGKDWCYRLACTDGPIFAGGQLLW